jgi:hypothetical protein
MNDEPRMSVSRRCTTAFLASCPASTSRRSISCKTSNAGPNRKPRRARSAWHPRVHFRCPTEIEVHQRDCTTYSRAALLSDAPLRTTNPLEHFLSRLERGAALVYQAGESRRRPLMLVFAPDEEVRFAEDSALEQAGFELPVPLAPASRRTAGLRLFSAAIMIHRRPTEKTVRTDRGRDGPRHAETRPPTPPTIGRHSRSARLDIDADHPARPRRTLRLSLR